MGWPGDTSLASRSVRERRTPAGYPVARRLEIRETDLMSLRFHEIAESRHRILNPLTENKLRQLGEICRITPRTRHLDLACGKGEMLTLWSAQYGSQGVGVDISKVFLEAAQARAHEQEVADRVRFVEAELPPVARPPHLS